MCSVHIANDDEGEYSNGSTYSLYTSWGLKFMFSSLLSVLSLVTCSIFSSRSIHRDWSAETRLVTSRLKEASARQAVDRQTVIIRCGFLGLSMLPRQRDL